MNPDDMADLFDQAVNQGKNGKQDALVSGTNIKTINGASVLGSGDLIISSAAYWGSITGTLSSQSDLQGALDTKQNTLVSGTSIKTVNNNSLLGSGNINMNPKSLGHSASTGSLSVSTAVTVSKSLLIPANTLTSDTLLDIQWRMIRVTGNTGQIHTRLYINTTNNISGATLISGITTLNGGGTQYAIKCEKTITCRNNGFAWMNSGSSEFTGVSLNAYNLNRTVDQYLLFTVQSASTGETGYVDFYRVLQYA